MFMFSSSGCQYGDAPDTGDVVSNVRTTARVLSNQQRGDAIRSSLDEHLAKLKLEAATEAAESAE
jgi:hypothetical protein